MQFEEARERAQREADLRKAIRLMRDHPGNLMAARIYLAVSKRSRNG
jgi:hypothetical protein